MGHNFVAFLQPERDSQVALYKTIVLTLICHEKCAAHAGQDRVKFSEFKAAPGLQSQRATSAYAGCGPICGKGRDDKDLAGVQGTLSAALRQQI